jgi:hypothetical protein
VSLRSILWALNEAPVNNPTEVAVLIALGDNAREDGTGACPGIKKVAARSRVSERTAQRTLRELETRGVIRQGDQSIAAYLGRYAPTVYDLAVELRREDLADDVDLYDGGPERRDAVDNQGRQSVTPPDSPAQQGRQSVTPRSPRGDTGGQQGVTLLSPKPSNKPTTPMAGVVSTAGGSATPVDNPPKIEKGRTAAAPRPGWDEFGPLSPKCLDHVDVAGDPPCRACQRAREVYDKGVGRRQMAEDRQRTRDLLQAQNRAAASRTVPPEEAAAAARAAIRKNATKGGAPDDASSLTAEQMAGSL